MKIENVEAWAKLSTLMFKLNKSFSGTVEIWEKAFVAARVQGKKYCMHGVEMLQS